MIKLHYTQEDLISNSSLRDAVQMLIMLGADIEQKKLVYSNWYKPDISIYPYITEYSCFIKMPLSDREWEVYEWLPWRQVNIAKDWEPEDIKTLTRSEWKKNDFMDQYEDWTYIYIPSDIYKKDPETWKHQHFSGQELQVFIDNLCTVITIEEYKQLLPQEEPNVI